MNDFLYVFRSRCGWVRIGRSYDPNKRLATITATCPPSIDLEIHDLAPDMGGHEAAVHRALETHRRRGEWFVSDCLAVIESAGGLASFAASLGTPPSNERCQFLRPDDKRRRGSPRWERYRDERRRLLCEHRRIGEWKQARTNCLDCGKEVNCTP